MPPVPSGQQNPADNPQPGNTPQRPQTPRTPPRPKLPPKPPRPAPDAVPDAAFDPLGLGEVDPQPLPVQPLDDRATFGIPLEVPDADPPGVFIVWNRPRLLLGILVTAIGVGLIVTAIIATIQADSLAEGSAPLPPVYTDDYAAASRPATTVADGTPLPATRAAEFETVRRQGQAQFAEKSQRAQAVIAWCALGAVFVTPAGIWLIERSRGKFRYG